MEEQGTPRANWDESCKIDPETSLFTLQCQQMQAFAEVSPAHKETLTHLLPGWTDFAQEISQPVLSTAGATNGAYL